MLSRRCMFLYHCTLRHPHEPRAPEIPSCNLSSCLYNIHPCRRVLNILKYKFKPKIFLFSVMSYNGLRAGNFLWAAGTRLCTIHMTISYSMNPLIDLAVHCGERFSSTHTRTQTPLLHPLIQRAADLPLHSSSGALFVFGTSKVI